MYYPFFRGKQFELITIRETAKILAINNFVPIIEPVRESFGGLRKTLQAVSDDNGKAVVIVNPYHGDYHENGNDIAALLNAEFPNSAAISIGILLHQDLSQRDAIEYYETHKIHNPTIIHAGFSAPKALAEHIGSNLKNTRHVFIENSTGMLYQRHFAKGSCILVRDGFNRQRNADYHVVEEFSELHVTYKPMGMIGFGDFSIVGDNYSEGGGPAYAVAIHLTFIDPDKDDVMYIYHFVSDDRDTPTDPAGKFAQALKKLITKLDQGNSKLLETSAIQEFRELHTKQHFPGLGYVKKLSMKHHIETLADYLSKN